MSPVGSRLLALRARAGSAAAVVRPVDGLEPVLGHLRRRGPLPVPPLPARPPRPGLPPLPGRAAPVSRLPQSPVRLDAAADAASADDHRQVRRSRRGGPRLRLRVRSGRRRLLPAGRRLPHVEARPSAETGGRRGTACTWRGPRHTRYGQELFIPNIYI